MINVNEFIRLREQNGLTQTELAQRVGCRQQLIHQIEAGLNKTTKKIYRIAAALGVPASQLDPDIPEHPLAEYFDSMKDWEPADTEWVVGRFKRDWEYIQSRRLGQTTRQPPKPNPSRTGGPARKRR